MAGALRKTMVYLGLAEDEEQRYDGYDVDEDFPDEAVSEAESEIERPEPRREVDHVEERRAPVTPIRAHVGRVVSPSSATPDLHRISTIHPRTYNEAKTIGEAFRAGTPVIMNLTDLDDADAKRLVDFAAGLIFGLRGSIERVTSKVFLLSPAHVEVSSADKVKVPERDFFNQS